MDNGRPIERQTAGADGGRLGRMADGLIGRRIVASADGALGGKRWSYALEVLYCSTSTSILLASQSQYVFRDLTRLSRTVLVLIGECSFI